MITFPRAELTRRLFLVAMCAPLAGLLSAADVDFNRDVRPVLSDVCYTCHGPDESQRVSELRLDTEAGAGIDLETGHAIVPGDRDSSLLYQRIRSDDPDFRMPPPDSGRELSSDQIATLGKWIDSGARWQEHWAFVTPSRPTPPSTQMSGWCNNEIDSFVLAKLEREGLEPSPKADRRTWIRRVTLDLTGVPPTLDKVRAFLADRSPDAFERVVDRLLASPRYGERMAISWLDAARYADTSGYQNDGPREMWRWRDWVIDALNRNMPFDRFTVEQLAGDLLPEATLSQKIATGFNRNHRGNAEGGIIPEEYQVEYVVDRVDTTATVWLGLTMGCARCHDHKYDPIAQRDFYRVFAFFNNIPEHGRAIKEGNSPPYIKAPTEAQQTTLQMLEAKAAAAALRFDALQSELARQQSAWENSFSGVSADDWTITDGLVDRFSLKGEGRFDGDSVKELGDLGDFGYFDNFTISAWIRPLQPTGTIISRMVPVEQGSGYYVHLEGGHLQVNLVKRWLDDAIRVQSKRKLPMNRTQHITVTYDGSRVAEGIALYLDGQPLELEVRLDGINQSFATDQPLRLAGGQSAYRGEIDDVQIYNRVLDAGEASVLAIPESISEIVARDPAERSIGQNRKLKRYFIEQQAADEIRNAYRASVETRRARDRFYESIPTVMVMQEKETPPAAFVLNRGRYDAPGEQVSPGVPSILPPLPEDVPRNRLGFAEWIVSPDHPLTARVTVNRVWQSLFGSGLVKTSEDFGAQGEMPSHPELLDWLATEFVRSGWDLKGLHRLIVTSATYQQDSRVSKRLRQLDPENRLLARGPRYRLPAESVRDQALLISGLLTEKIGGPSVRPYQPQGLWKEIASTTNYQQSQGADLYRRSLYSYWKRTVAPPTMVTLDAVSREACVVKRTRTNTPLQALALMNEVTFVEAARVLAERFAIRSELSDSDRLAIAFETVTCRPPTDAELKRLRESLGTYRDAFRLDASAAEELTSVGQSKRDDKVKVDELAAWTMLASILLNLDEVITKE